ncbi:MAG TPA: glucan biosynthesis protein G [Candidatus Tectomicrobia bacterium]|nr:glucan biosynthesis protein G [Candidatus Tectomicrobia bacterium]
MLAATLALLGLLAAPVADAWAFGLDDVAARAAKLAASPYRKPAPALPETLKTLTYDQYRDIRFRPERALWRDARLPFEVMFFHRGFFFEERVTIHEVVGPRARAITFDPDAFDYGKNRIERDQLGDLGFAGFRVHFPVNTPAYRDEVLVFLGASYFRALGRGQRYGLSARGLAIDTAESTPEEFPRFVEYWIERPAPGARALTVYALLDSPRAAGAYRFVLHPGVTTVLDVDARLFLRDDGGKFGLAPLTSMFLFGPNQRPAREDYRPRVHDSQGLSIHTGAKEWIWRPLVHPRRLLVTSFAVMDPRGFGLMQRERTFGEYQDLEARYDLRPSAWVEPKGAWGAGRVELVQIPVPDETHDNIVAYWVPDRAPRPGTPFAYGYRVLWQKDRETRPPFGWVRETRRGRGYVKADDGSVEFHVDFDGPTLARLPAGADVNLALWVDGNGEVVESHTRRNDATGGWRAVVRLRRVDSGKPVEMRAHLSSGSEVLSETWSYILPPD